MLRLDVSQATTAICVVEDEGKMLAVGITATEPGAIATFVRRRAPDAVRIGLETGPLAVWLWIELRALGLPVVCIDARHANAGLEGDAGQDRSQRRRGHRPAGPHRLVPPGPRQGRASHAVRAELASGPCWCGCAATSRTRSAAC